MKYYDKEGNPQYVQFDTYHGRYVEISAFALHNIDVSLRRIAKSLEAMAGKTKEFWGWEKEDELAEYPSFWVSGGCCGFDGDYSESYVCPGDWEMEDGIHEKDYPNEIWNLLPKILELMNDNVPCGCCGGCWPY